MRPNSWSHIQIPNANNDSSNVACGEKAVCWNLDAAILHGILHRIGVAHPTYVVFAQQWRKKPPPFGLLLLHQANTVRESTVYRPSAIFSPTPARGDE